VVFAGLSGALGLGLGSLLANQVVAVTLALLVLFVLEPGLTELIDGYQRCSVVGVRTAIIGGSAQTGGRPRGRAAPVLACRDAVDRLYRRADRRGRRRRSPARDRMSTVIGLMQSGRATARAR
jgi:hypothetical protein